MQHPNDIIKELISEVLGDPADESSLSRDCVVSLKDHLESYASPINRFNHNTQEEFVMEPKFKPGQAVTITNGQINGVVDGYYADRFEILYNVKYLTANGGYLSTYFRENELIAG